MRRAAGSERGRRWKLQWGRAAAAVGGGCSSGGYESEFGNSLSLSFQIWVLGVKPSGAGQSPGDPTTRDRTPNSVPIRDRTPDSVPIWVLGVEPGRVDPGATPPQGSSPRRRTVAGESMRGGGEIGGRRMRKSTRRKRANGSSGGGGGSTRMERGAAPPARAAGASGRAHRPEGPWAGRRPASRAKTRKIARKI